ncbi:hypothetical protein B7463_g4876, partial [Scytalidium lignicola]
MVVLSQYGCSTEAFSQVPSDCASSRGMMFNPNTSSTWVDAGLYYINQNGVGLEANLGYVQAADFGLDTLGLGLVAGADGPTLEKQVVGGIATASPFYLGIFGLGIQPVNFTTLGNSSTPTFFQSLKDQGYIPSLSWSYTAGAIYRLKEVYGQLIFGGYDTSRFVESGVSFTMAVDATRDIVVALQSIVYSGGTETSLLSSPILTFIDSTDPNIWLPESACKAFESAFGITLDNKTGLYLVNDSHHEQLLLQNSQVSFVISDTLVGGSTVTVTLPYQAFDLMAQYPLVSNTSYYFPLKQATNETQYTLGRTFLQEAYLTVDYERRNFTVSQCAWDAGATSHIVPIESIDFVPPSPSNSAATANPTSSSSSSKHGISSGAIAGIVIGVVAAFSIAGLAFFFLRRKRKTDEGIQPMPEDNMSSYETTLETLPDGSKVYQLHSIQKVPERHELEAAVSRRLPGPGGVSEAGSEIVIGELDAGRVGTELDASRTATPSVGGAGA